MAYRLQQPNEVFNISFENLNIIDNIQELWVQYVMWQRSLLLAQAFNNPNLTAIQERVYRIPMDYYNTLRVFYGERIAQQMLTYVQGGLIIQRRLINAMITNDQNAVNTYAQQLYSNADELARFLGQFPYWDESRWKSLLYQDISMFFDEINAVLTGEYEKEIDIYERFLANAVASGRYMAAGILQSLAAPSK